MLEREGDSPEDYESYQRKILHKVGLDKYNFYTIE